MDAIAFDAASVRSKDKNGFLHISMSNISKADVNPYFGREIPNMKALGLDAGKIYYLLRHPDELAKAASTFNNLPILDRHVPINAALPAQDEWIGSTGTDGNFFNGRYLRNSSVLWKQDPIDDVDNNVRKQWSSAYHYRAEMTPGKFNGLRYDGIMRDIAGNHLCLVETGRAGPDIAVGDSIGEHNMKRIALLTAAATSVLALVAPALAMDSADETKGKITFDDIFAALEEIPGLAMDADDKPADTDEDCDGDSDDVKADKAKRRAAKKPPAMDNAPMVIPPVPAVVPPVIEVKDDKMDKIAMDAAIADATAKAEARVKTAMRALRTAERDVFPLVGEVVAMDSAEDVYKFALTEHKVDIEGVDPSAYRSLVAMAVAGTKSPTVAMDKGLDHKGARATFRERFPKAVAPLKL